MHPRALLLVLGAAAALPSRGSAQPASVQAQSLFDDGRKLLASGKIAEACAAFDASQKLDPLVTTELNVAACREQNGQLATAWGAFVEAERMARASGDDKLQKVATSHAQKLEPRLSRLTIAVPPEHRLPGLEILRGKDPVNPASWDHALPIDGGSYTITARAPGHEAWSTTRTIKAERDTQTIAIPKLGDARPQAPPTAPVAGPTSPAPPVNPPSPVSHGDAAVPATGPGSEPPAQAATHQAVGPSYLAPIALGAAALALGGVGLGFELKSETTYDHAKTASQQGNTADANSSRDAAVRDRYIAQGLAVAALGCAGVGIYLFVRDRGERPTAAVLPVASSGLAGVALVGRW